MHRRLICNGNSGPRHLCGHVRRLRLCALGVHGAPSETSGSRRRGLQVRQLRETTSKTLMCRLIGVALQTVALTGLVGAGVGVGYYVVKANEYEESNESKRG